LTDADGEQVETQYWIETAFDCEYVDRNTSTQLTEKCLEIGRMLGGMMEKSEMFCGEPSHTFREDAADYFTN
jgi:four helix bundle protein